VSFLAAPAIVPGPPDQHENSHFSSLHGQHALSKAFTYGPRDHNDTCPPMDPAAKALITSRVDVLMYLEFGLIAACFLAIVVHFPSKPKRPPSVSSSVERMDFLPGLKRICVNRNALLSTVAFSLFNGLIASWYSVMNITFAHLPLGHEDDKDRIIGYIGLWAIVGNSVAAILVSRFVDSIRGKMKKTLLVLMSLGILCWIWLGLLCLRVIPFSIRKS